MKEIKRGEIYSADFGVGFGSEQGGVRPVLILQNNTGNKHSPTTIVAAITGRKTKAALPTHVAIITSGLKTESTVLLEQIRTIDKARLHGLRHMFATILIERGVPLVKISGLLGHNSIHTTYEYYCEVMDEKDKIIAFMNDTFVPERTGTEG